MTIHTKAATDEIYELFSQPLRKDDEMEEQQSSDDEDDYTTDGDYTSGGESTGTGRLTTASETGDDETTDTKSVSEWSEFTTRKHVPDMNADDSTRLSIGSRDDLDDTRASLISVDDNAEDRDLQDDAFEDDEAFEAVEPRSSHGYSGANDQVTTPISPELPAMAKTTFVPIPPEDYVAPLRPYRDAAQISQNRLPFMTPIAEKTESSMGGLTGRPDKDFASYKTPSKSAANTKIPLRLLEGIDSSPFRECVDDAPLPESIPQPALSRSVNTTTLKDRPSKGQSRAALTGADVAKGPIIQDLQCNPIHATTKTMILEGLSMPLRDYAGYYAHEDQAGGRTAEIRKYIKALTKASKGSGDKTTTSVSMPPVLSFPEVKRQYAVKRELGAGAYAPVYLVESEVDEVTLDDKPSAMGQATFDHFDRRRCEALKMEIVEHDAPSPWEFYIMRQAKRRLGVARAAESIIDVYEMHVYKDETFLIEEYRDQGTLLDLVNTARAEAAGSMDESLVIFFTIELLRTIEALHSKSILHGDLKADNCLVRLDMLSDADVWSSRYRRDGSNGWNKKGLALIDFGRGIDLKAFRADVQFYADWEPSPQDCAEIRGLRPWTYQIDYHGLAGIIHTMLFGKYIETIEVRGEGLGDGLKKHKIKESLKRYWQTDIWSRLFDLLLNPASNTALEEGTRMPILRSLKSIREEMETWLEVNSERGIGLQSMIRKLEFAIQSRKK